MLLICHGFDTGHDLKLPGLDRMWQFFRASIHRIVEGEFLQRAWKGESEMEPLKKAGGHPDDYSFGHLVDNNFDQRHADHYLVSRLSQHGSFFTQKQAEHEGNDASSLILKTRMIMKQYFSPPWPGCEKVVWVVQQD